MKLAQPLRTDIAPLIHRLHDSQVIQLGEEGKLEHNPSSSVPIAPAYFNIRQLRSYPELHHVVADEYLKVLETLDFDLVADIPLGATTLAWELASKTGKPLITPRMQGKDYGSDRNILGRYTPGQRVVMIDDVIVRATKKQEAITMLRDAGLEVVALIAFVDWERGGRERLEGQGIDVYTLTTAAEAIAILS